MLGWTNDWHIGKKSLPEYQAAAAHIASIADEGCIDLGDCKDGFPGTGQLADYIATVRDVLPWLALNPGANADAPILPGNHDERLDYTTPGSDFSPFDAALWGPPYHWTADRPAARVRIIALHARIVHVSDVLPYSGFFAVQPAEVQWVADELDALPDGWVSLVCSHPPLNPAFGNNIGVWPWLSYGGAELLAVLAARAPKIAAYLCGHRHVNMLTNELDGVLHICGPSVSYTIGNGRGGFVPIEYDATLRTLTFHYHYASAPFEPFSGYTPIVVTLPPLAGPVTYTFDASSTLVGAGPLAGSPVTIAGTVEA